MLNIAPASGTINPKILLRCVFIACALAALSASALRGPHGLNDREPLTADQPVDAGSETAALTKPASPDIVRPFAALSRFVFTSAHPAPMRRVIAAAAVPMATLRRGVSASAEAVPQQFFRDLIAANPQALRSLPPTRLVLAALPGVTFDPHAYTSPQVKRAPGEFAYLADYAYSEAPPPEKPADTVARALKDIPEGTPVEEVQRAARAFGLDVIFMEAVAKVESDFDPKQRTGSYIGIFQLSKYEFDLYGSGDITDARDNAIAGAYKFAVASILFELSTHQKATPEYLYLIHQQGTQGAAEHVAQPDRIAWQSMCATDEGRMKGEAWCKRAIWQNTLPDVKKAFVSVDKLTSAAFVTMWNDRLAALYRRYSLTASASAAR